MGKDCMNYFDLLALAEEQYKRMLEEHPELTKLSKREIDVFAQLLTDKTQEQIAQSLYISRSSVHFHCKNIYKKLELHSRRQLLVKYRFI